MPELPDLEVFSFNLNKLLKGKTFKQILIYAEKNLNLTLPVINKTLAGQRLSKVYRSGKEMFFEFSKGNILALHLMLHGDFHFFKSGHALKHVTVELLFRDGSVLAVTDWQKQTRINLDPPAVTAPDALSKNFNQQYLVKICSAKRTSIKNVITDQQIVRGIGNAYADEILWDARISPFSIASKIPAQKLKRLVTSVKRVLKNSGKQIRKACPGLVTGEVREFLKIHSAGKKRSPGGAAILHRTTGGRKTYFTKEQQLY